MRGAGGRQRDLLHPGGGGSSGYPAPPDDAEGMAGALLQLLQDAAFHAGMRQRALAQAGRFSWEQTARRTLDAYREALEAKTHARR